MLFSPNTSKSTTPCINEPRLEIFNRSLVDGGGFTPSRLAWFVEAKTFDRREYVWVDAETGGVLLNFNQHAALAAIDSSTMLWTRTSSKMS